MPGIGLHRRALDVFSQADDRAIKKFFHDHYHDQNREGKWGRRVMRRKNFSHALHSEAERSEQHAHRHGGRRHRFRFSVAIRVGRIRRARGEFQPAPDHGRAADVERGFNSIRDQNVGIAEEARGNFCRREHDVDEHSDQRDARAALHIAGGIVRCRMKRLRHL